ncbi:hypothetical protein WR25_08289 [Diploscapter pachys]|uniref:ER lumen protein-retaining receptor n=1 Tax=Diploscapter pachys TaxID=2018661 RepID=A0A2A2LHL1_9BILA|nr:hypothetical protein WR25_08289 [Diploscapter pachys]
MNVFRLTGDMSHLLAVILLLVKIHNTRSCSGLSLRSQILFALVFTFRYLDLFLEFYSIYNTTMKIIYLITSYTTLYFMVVKFKSSYEKETHWCRMEYLAIPSLILTAFVTREYALLEMAWTFSIILESVAIMPQLVLLSSSGTAEVITAHYLFLLGVYRTLYIANWVYRFHVEGFFDPTSCVFGVIQSVLYADFFYLYFTRIVRNRKFQLPFHEGAQAGQAKNII